MDGTVAAVTAEDLARTFAELAVRLRCGDGSLGTCDPGPDSGPVSGSGADPLRRRADECLEALATVARAEAMIAALKVYAASDFASIARTVAGPAVSPEDHTGQDMSIVAEVACALTVSERTAGGLLGEAHRLTTALPLTLAALQ
ncbi:MAG: endonuclease, partial [Pseudarthrobacter sp.]|nr:endonuclease [Pseudarthrobacter sp.]